MSVRSVPDWVSAVVAILLFVGSVVGLYVGISNKVAVISSQVEGSFTRYDAKLKELDEYQAFLQKQIDEGKSADVVIQTKMGYMETGQKDLAIGFKELANELRKTNEYLIEMRTSQSIKTKVRGQE